MELFFVLLLIAALIAQVMVAILSLRQLRQIDDRLRVIASLTRDTRSSQGSIGIRYSQGGPVPGVKRAKHQGSRGDLPATGHMGRGLKFERRGGEYERNRDGDGKGN